MTHQFETEEAINYGIEAAIILQNIRFWISKNRANQKHFYDGKYWTYNSYEAFGKLFPYMKPRQIRRTIQNLEDKEIIIAGNYNTNTFDKTKWYAINDLIDAPKMAHPTYQNERIQHTKTSASLYTDNKHTDINTDNKENYFEENDFLEPNNFEEEKTFIQTENSFKKEKISAKKEKSKEFELEFEQVYQNFYKAILNTDGLPVFGKWEKVAFKEIIEKCKKLTVDGQSPVDVWRVIANIDSWKTMEKFWQDKFGIKQLNNNFDSIFYQMKNHRERNKSSNKYMPGLEEAHRINSQKLKDGTLYKNPLEDLQYKS